MNAAFLLVTTAWIAGADASAPAAPAAAPVYSTSTGGCAGGGCAGGGCAGGGCSSCGACDSCGGESEGLLSKLKARFHHSSDCGCGGESEGLLSKLKGRLHKSDCGCDSGCDACESHGSKLHGRLGGLFHKSESCGCESGCGGCGGGGCAGVISTTPGATMPRAEPIGPPKEEPKKLPSGDGKGEKKPGSVQLIPQPVGAPMLELAPASGKSPF